MKRRTHRSPASTIPSRFPSRSRAVLACGLFAAAVLSPSAALATLQSVEAVPAEATVCDSVTLALAGTLPDPCYTLRGVRVGPIEPLDTYGPVPVYRIRVRLVAEEPNPALTVVCPTVTQPYHRRAPLGRLPFGHFIVDAVEYLHAFPADSMPPIDSSRVSITFNVAPDSCRAEDGCVLLGFAPVQPPVSRLDPCTARTGPGGRACFDVTLMNGMSVGGLQTEIVVSQPYRDAASVDLFVPVGVETTPRAAGFEAAWTAEGSTVKILLFSTIGALLPPGNGPLLHVCYEVNPGTPDGAYAIHFRNELVAGPRGEAIPQCPTFARVEGRICVGDRPTCDLNGDGIGDVRDVLRLVRCILAGTGGSDACPDSIRARADCNEDGVVDVRDLICCVRRILAHDGGWGDAPPTGDEPTGTPARIGFDGDAVWTTPYEGIATVRVEPGEAFGGMQWVVDPGAAARVRDVVLDDPEGPYAVSWGPDAGGAARVILYDRGALEEGAAAGGAAAANPSVRIVLEPTPGAGAGGEIALRGWRAASQDGTPVFTQALATLAALPANAAAGVPAVLPARPNPFVGTTEIVYSLPAAGNVSLRLFDVTGRLVRTLVSGRVEAGVHRTSWDGRDARGRETGSGVYFVRFDAAGIATTQRLMRLR